MREIKFRIFIGGSFCYWGFIDGAFVGVPTSSSECLSLEQLKERSQQYIGVKDKNGVEIYVGDIVHKSKQHGVWSVVYAYFGEPSFKVSNHLNSGREIDTADYENENPHFSFDGTGIIEIEVIGNTSENPELLKREI